MTGLTGHTGTAGPLSPKTDREGAGGIVEGICVDWGRYGRCAQRLRLRSGMIDFVRLPMA